jgi:hypothetical protein
MSADDGTGRQQEGGASLALAPLAAAARSGDEDAVATALDSLAETIGAEPLAARPTAEGALALLQEARLFEPMARFCERLIRLGHDDAHVRRRYAQALIECGRPVAALGLLGPLTRSEGGAPAEERAVAIGTTGRAYKQLYVDSRRERPGAPSTVYLKQALAAYARGCTEGSLKDQRRCMINLVALLVCGARDNGSGEGVPEARALARRLIADLTRGGAGPLTQWDAATLAEAHVALGDLAAASHWYGRYAEHPEITAFQLASAIRQLEEVWGFAVTSPDGGPLLTALKTKLIGTTSGEIAISGADRAYLRGMETSGAAYEAVLGKDGPMRVRWLKAGLETARGVGRIRDRLTGRTWGTGFLARGGDLKSELGDQPVVITNSHVVSARSPAALGPGDADILFDEAEASLPLTFTGIVFESPADALDVTILTIKGQPGVAPLALAPLDYLADDLDRLSEARRRAIVIGHAGGRDLAVSLADTEIVDLGYRDAERQGGLFVHYRTPTAPGSSGSPVFTPDRWQVAALHHAGPAGTHGLKRLSGRAGHHRANEGIAIASIAAAMARTSKPVAIALPAPPPPAETVPATAKAPAAIAAQAPAQPALPPIGSPAELQAALERLDIPERELRPLLEADRQRSEAFAPEVVAKREVESPGRPRRLGEDAFAESAPVALVESLNTIARWRRQRAYAAKIKAGWTDLRFVAQGDSWFQYPFLVEDVIDHLFAEHAILDLSGAGRTLHDIGLSDELVHAVKSEMPNGVLLSGGGNDILGEQAIKLYLKDYAPGRPVADYAEPTLAAHLDLIVAQYERIVGRLQAVSPSLRVFCHGYDWAIPDARKGAWLAGPMTEKGIVEPGLQQSLVRLLIDRFNEALRALERRYPGRVLVVDCRGAVGAERWYDELHPNDQGFGDVAARFRKRIARAFDLATG